MSRRKLFENAALLGMVQLASIAIPVLTLPYLAAVLGPDALGEMAFAIGVAQIFTLLTEYGFNLSAARFVARHREEPAMVFEVAAAVTQVRGMLAAGGLILLCALGFFWDRAGRHFGLFLAAYVAVPGVVLFPQWLFQGLENLRFVSSIQILARITLSLLIFALVRGPQDAVLATLLQTAGPALGGLLVMPHTLRLVGRGRWPTFRTVLSHARDGWNLFLSSAMVGLYTNCNTFFVGLAVAPAELASYHIAEKMVRAVLALYGAAANAVYPHVSRLALDDRQSLVRFNRRLLLFFEAVALPVAIGLFFGGPLLIEVFFGHNYFAATKVLHVLAWVPVVVVASNVLGIQTMLPLGMETEFRRVILASAIFSLFTFLPATLVWGVRGAAWVNLLVEIMVVAQMALLLARWQPRSRPPRPTTKTIPIE